MEHNNSLDLNWVLKHSGYLVKECMKVIDGQTAAKGKDAGESLTINFIAMFIGTILHRSLVTRPAGLFDKDEIYEYTQNNFAITKGKIQDAVAHGFQGAMQSFSGKQVEYYCQVRPVGDPVNRLPV
jgi:hypothetical protein